MEQQEHFEFEPRPTIKGFPELRWGDYCAVKAPGLNGNSATILPFSPSHSIVERQLNAI